MQQEPRYLTAVKTCLCLVFTTSPLQSLCVYPMGAAGRVSYSLQALPVCHCLRPQVRGLTTPGRFRSHAAGVALLEQGTRPGAVICKTPMTRHVDLGRRVTAPCRGVGKRNSKAERSKCGQASETPSPHPGASSSNCYL